MIDMIFFANSVTAVVATALLSLMLILDISGRVASPCAHFEGAASARISPDFFLVDTRFSPESITLFATKVTMLANLAFNNGNITTALETLYRGLCIGWAILAGKILGLPPSPTRRPAKMIFSAFYGMNGSAHSLTALGTPNINTVIPRVILSGLIPSARHIAALDTAIRITERNLAGLSVKILPALSAMKCFALTGYRLPSLSSGFIHGPFVASFVVAVAASSAQSISALLARGEVGNGGWFSFATLGTAFTCVVIWGMIRHIDISLLDVGHAPGRSNVAGAFSCLNYTTNGVNYGT